MGHQGRRKKARQHGVWLGLTGSLASGKSTALKAFKKNGFRAVSADSIVSRIYKEAGLSKDDLRQAALHPKDLKKLERWVHPLVKKKILKFLKTSSSPAVVEVPLLFEAKMAGLFDATIFVFAPLKDRRRRVLKRGMSDRLFKTLEAKQMPAEKKQALADFVLQNYSKASLQKQVKWLSKLVRLLYKK